ncbi:hypothetical protein HG536_0F00490 [Torulaspora globosa]|uniref:WD repeat-containing protein JIP5 n=1 Tax=Torulaspora globosa TaxID=48254 RepID=A0A7G3ZJP0_9SACH|nr:uncharacterized protein HG536_0F00490 [Torulaspora globosa]QLL33726.1 hypothetical protein HG536_0F00490 [Torulaspora globosa]
MSIRSAGGRPMGKKSKLPMSAVEEPLAEWRFPQPVFQMVLHPERPMLLCGLADGHVYCYSYDAARLQQTLAENKKQRDRDGQQSLWTCVEAGDEESPEGVRLEWRTRRHRGSVRCMCLDADGTYVYSVGTDNVLKKARSDTGKVVQKVTLREQTCGFTKMAKSATHAYLLLGDEDGNVTVVNSETLKRTNRIVKIHGGDAINDIFQFAKRSVHKYISLGQTTLAYWDARECGDDDAKRKVVVSDNQEDEMLCGAFVDPEAGDTVVCGMGEGVLTVWKPNKNDLEDQMNRIKICQNESVDCVVPTLQDDDAVWCGCSDGKIYKADVKRGRVVEVRTHSDDDEVTFIDLDYEYRVVSGGMDKIVLWQSIDEKDASSSESDAEQAPTAESDNDVSSDAEITDDSSSDSEDGTVLVGLSREELIAELDKDLAGDDTDEQKPEEPRKNKNKKRKLAGKQASSHGIAKFEGL